MRILLINPNISQSVSDLIGAEARRTASPSTVIEVATAPLGVAYIETRFEALIGAYAAAVLAAERQSQHDALVIAAFGDPGLAGIREAVDIPVVGLSEAALLSACMLGHFASHQSLVPRNGADARPDRSARQHPLPEPVGSRHWHRAAGS